MKIKKGIYAIQVQSKLIDILETEIRNHRHPTGKPCIINFRDPSYSAEAGGFHPVEIMINHLAEILYITDFSYVGIGGYAELEKELDFDFENGVFQSHAGLFPIEKGKEIFGIFQNNFCTYYDLGVFKVSVEEL